MSKEGGTKEQWSVKQDITSHLILSRVAMRKEVMVYALQHNTCLGRVCMYKRRETQWRLLVPLLPHLEKNRAIVVLLEVDGDKDHLPGNTTHHVLLSRAGFAAPFGG